MKIRPYLIQRLEKPKSFVNPFSFGGGLRNGGLSNDAMELIKPIFSFDYMGSAEFEFGEIPKCFQRVTKKDDWVRDEVEGKMKIKYPSRPRNITEGKVTVYIYSPKSILDDVKEYVKMAIKNEFDLVLKENLLIQNSCLYIFNGEECDIRGWVDIENDFFFFIDKEMRDKTADMFDEIRDSSRGI